MEKYKFVFNEKEYELGEDNCSYMIIDEENPVSGIELEDILELLNQGQEVEFGVEYYDELCEECLAGKEEKAKNFKFLEFHFFIFTKKGEYVIANISKEYENLSYNKLLKNGKVDNSYIVSIIVCFNCGTYSVEIEQYEI